MKKAMLILWIVVLSQPELPIFSSTGAILAQERGGGDKEDKNGQHDSPPSKFPVHPYGGDKGSKDPPDKGKGDNKDKSGAKVPKYY